jgi:hypothetical protein
MHSDHAPATAATAATSPIAAADAERADFDTVPLIDFSAMVTGVAASAGDCGCSHRHGRC